MILSHDHLHCYREVRCGAPYTTAVDMWSIGIVTLFLLKSACPCSLIDATDQCAIDQAVDDIFLNIFSRSEQAEDILRHFVKSCLTVNPEKRLTSRQAKAHPWFQQQPDKEMYNEVAQKYSADWTPQHLITPPVEELPEVESDDEPRQSVKVVKPTQLKKRVVGPSNGYLENISITEPRSRKSPYFSPAILHISKKTRLS